MSATTSKILVVDDDELTRELMVVLLESEGHETVGFESGEEALDALRAGTTPVPTGIFTDLQMPGISGNPLAEALRTIAPKAVVLAISASQPDAAAISSFDGFLLKPFDAAKLTAALANPPKLAVEAETASTPADGPPVLDQATYKTLASQMPPSQLRQLYELSLADANRRVPLIQAAYDANDETTFVREAHSLQGGCGLIGALELRTLAKTMETGGLPAVTLLPQISASIARLQGMLESLADL